ncbi:DUF5361 domain-containing protein [Nocardia sp. NPDC049149]|uniref:DUF5361 domain-containing protein n=1 Tax=Nocardia sp. NPDC049149 TaxID=3364315 RepID=UPI0037215CF8
MRLHQLGTEVLGWRELKAIIRWLPTESALFRAMNPESHRWQLDQFLLADITDSLRWLVWAKTDDARNGRNRPELVPRPGVKSDRERIGTATGIDEMNEFLNWDE